MKLYRSVRRLLKSDQSLNKTRFQMEQITPEPTKTLVLVGFCLSWRIIKGNFIIAERGPECQASQFPTNQKLCELFFFSRSCALRSRKLAYLANYSNLVIPLPHCLKRADQWSLRRNMQSIILCGVCHRGYDSPELLSGTSYNVRNSCRWIWVHSSMHKILNMGRHFLRSFSFLQVRRVLETEVVIAKHWFVHIFSPNFVDLRVCLYLLAVAARFWAEISWYLGKFMMPSIFTPVPEPPATKSSKVQRCKSIQSIYIWENIKLLNNIFLIRMIFFVRTKINRSFQLLFYWFNQTDPSASF